MYCDKCRVIVKQRMNEMSRLFGNQKVLKARSYVSSETNDWYLRKSVRENEVWLDYEVFRWKTGKRYKVDYWKPKSNEKKDDSLEMFMTY